MASIRVQESIQNWNQRRSAVANPGPEIQTLDGWVERVDFQRSSFEIRDQSRERVIIALP